MDVSTYDDRKTITEKDEIISFDSTRTDKAFVDSINIEIGQSSSAVSTNLTVSNFNNIAHSYDIKPSNGIELSSSKECLNSPVCVENIVSDKIILQESHIKNVDDGILSLRTKTRGKRKKRYKRKPNDDNSLTPDDDNTRNHSNVSRNDIETVSQVNTSISKNAKKKSIRNKKKIQQITDYSVELSTHGAEHTILEKSDFSSNKAPVNGDSSCNGDILHVQNMLLNARISSNSDKQKQNAAKSHLQTSQSPSKSMKNKKDTHKKYTFQRYLEKADALKRLENKELIEGPLRINPKHFQTAYVSNPIVTEPDYVIEGVANRNRALDGDIVLLSVAEMPTIMNNDRVVQKTGRVVYIKQKTHPRTSVGHIKLMEDMNRRMALFIPRDHRIPRIYIPFTCWPFMFYENHKEYGNVLFVAKIEEWTDVKFAVGSLISNIGHSGELKSESVAILAENNLDVTPYSKDMQQYYPRPDYVIPAEELSNRRDCRDMCIFTIDPLTARDLDDALSCTVLANGNLEVGVHIADVSFFLKEGTELNEKVAQKATTIYMVERAYHMLPEDLCLLCSLLPGLDKLTFSVFWEFTKSGQVVNQSICRTVINSCTQLAYEHAQKMLENPDLVFSQEDFPQIHGKWTTKDISRVVCDLFELSKIFKKQRYESGALKIDQPKLLFRLDTASGLPLSYSIYENKESHRLIEEFMLLANMTVAKKIYEEFPRLAFLRRHPAPNVYMLNEIAKNLEPLGILLDVSTAKRLQTSMLHFSRADCDDDGISLVLNALLVKPMARALYFCADGYDDDDFWHYALNVPLYTHFTSPIRRFADIMVHRLLSASIGHSEKPEWNVNDVHMIAENCNRQKYNAKRAGEMSSEMYTYMYISQNAPIIVKAVVVDVKMNSIDTVILDNGLARRVHFGNCKAKVNFVRGEKSEKLNKILIVWPVDDHSPEVNQTIELFSKVNLILEKTDVPFKITSQLMRPSIALD